MWGEVEAFVKGGRGVEGGGRGGSVSEFAPENFAPSPPKRVNLREDKLDGQILNRDMRTLNKKLSLAYDDALDARICCVQGE